MDEEEAADSVHGKLMQVLFSFLRRPAVLYVLVFVSQIECLHTFVLQLSTEIRSGFKYCMRLFPVNCAVVVPCCIVRLTIAVS